MLSNRWKTALPIIATVVVIFVTALQLRNQGRLWWCDCGHLLVWSGDAWGPETSQHFFDPYAFTHILHGLAFYGLLVLLVPRLRTIWRFWLAVLIESVWEIVENTEFVIQRYREATAALGYTGDSVINSLGDVVACGVGFWIARKLGLRGAVLAFILIEVVLLLAIRDSLLLNIIMLIRPSAALKAWQAGH